MTNLLNAYFQWKVNMLNGFVNNGYIHPPLSDDIVLDGKTLSNFSSDLRNLTMIDAVFFTRNKSLRDDYNDIRFSCDDFDHNDSTAIYWEDLSNKSQIAVSDLLIKSMISELESKLKPLKALRELYAKEFNAETANDSKQAATI